jgi:DICT domain-containing protein
VFAVNLDNGLSIGDLARRAGIGVSTLRAWERRHGYPVPQRLASGHRRFVERDVETLREVLRDRAAGSTLQAALGRARERAIGPRSSVFGALTHALPDVAPVVLRRPTLLAMSRAIEDECITRAARPVLVGAFQQQRHWRASEQRWRDLAATSEVTVALAAGMRRRQRGALWEAPIAPGAPVQREWALVCDSPTFAACLVGVELPPDAQRREDGRSFEALWTVEPVAVRRAARAAADVVAGGSAALDDVLRRRLEQPAPVTGDTVRSATSLTNRMLAYVESAGPVGSAHGARWSR